MKKLTFIILSLLLLAAYADQAEAQRKKWELAGRPASLDLDFDTVILKVPGRVVALLTPAVQKGPNLAGPSQTMGRDDPALIVYDPKNPTVRKIFPLTEPVFADGPVRLIGFANVAKDADGSDDKEAILEIRKDITIECIVSHKTGLVMAFQDHDLLGVRNYDGSEDGFLDMLLYNRKSGTMELWGK